MRLQISVAGALMGACLLAVPAAAAPLAGALSKDLAPSAQAGDDLIQVQFGGGTSRILRDVYWPAIQATLLSIAVFLFMRSMVTLSAIIFLFTPAMSLGAVSVMRLDEAGFTSQAAAFSTCIMALVGSLTLALHFLAARTQAVSR